jgi:hypothetical protein
MKLNLSHSKKKISLQLSLISILAMGYYFEVIPTTCFPRRDDLFFGRLKLSFIVGALYDVNYDAQVENLNLGSPHLYGVLRPFIWSLAVAIQDRVFPYYVPNSSIKHSKSDSKDRSQEIL